MWSSGSCAAFFLAGVAALAFKVPDPCWGYTASQRTTMEGADIKVERLSMEDCCARCRTAVAGCRAAVYTADGRCLYKAAMGAAGTDAGATLLVLEMPSPAPGPGPAPPPAGAFPRGDGLVAPNFWAGTPAWTAADGRRLHAHSGMVFRDAVSGMWHWVGNSDAEGSDRLGQNSQISLYSSDNLYGPWSAEVVLATLEGMRDLLGEGNNVTLLERPKVHQDAGTYYLFVHVDDDAYRKRSICVIRMANLAAQTASNPWTVVFHGRPGSNPNRGGRGFEVLDFNIFFDPVSKELLYMSTADAYVPSPPSFCDTDVDPAECTGSRCFNCFNTALMMWSLDLDALRSSQMTAASFRPRGVLPGRWEAPVLFRKPGDSRWLYLLCSGQDGFGPNPVSLFRGALGVEAPPLASGMPASDYPWPALRIFSCLGLPFSGSATALNSQPVQVLANPHDSAHAVYMGDNWLHGPGKDYTSEACSDPSKGPPSSVRECEAFTGTCPCQADRCPAVSRPGAHAGYIWVSFAWERLGSTEYLICAGPPWNLRAPSTNTGPCYTFNVFPQVGITPGYADVADYEGKAIPFTMNNCGFQFCFGWPMTLSQNAPTRECCSTMGDFLTNPKTAGNCWRETLCGGICNDTDFGNIPGGHGGCTMKPFDPSQAVLLNSGKDCTTVRQDYLALDPCRGHHSLTAPLHSHSPGLPLLSHPSLRSEEVIAMPDQSQGLARLVWLVCCLIACYFVCQKGHLAFARLRRIRRLPGA